MATTQKKKSIESFLGFAQPEERRNYITPSGKEDLDKEFYKGRPVMRQEGDKSVFKRKSGTLSKDKNGKEVAELKPLEMEGEVKEEAQAPRPLKERILPPEEPVGDPPPLAPKYAPPAAAPAAKPQVQDSTGPSAWERFLVGATPALVGLLSGNELEGISLSGQTLANTEADRYKRELDFHGKLQEMKAKKALGAADKNDRKPSFARETLYDPQTKKSYVHSIVDGQDMGVLGEAAPDKVRESYMKETMYNPQTRQMEVATINPRTKEVTFHGVGEAKSGKRALADLDFQGESTKAVVDLDEGKVVSYLGKNPEKKSPYEGLEAGRMDRFKQQKMQDFAGKLTSKGSVFNDKKANVDGIVKAASMLNSGVPIANAGLRNYIARNIFGEKGPLSDGDVTRLEGDPSLMERVSRFYEKWSTGNITEIDREDMRAVIEIAHKLEAEDAVGEASRVGRAFSVSGIDMTPIVQAYTTDSIKPLPKFVAGRGSSALKQTFATPKVGEVRKGYRFKGGDPSKSESWEKQ